MPPATPAMARAPPSGKIRKASAGGDGSAAMNLLEELRALDPRDPGRWPLPIRAGAVGLAFVVLTAALVYFFVWSEQRPELQQHQAEEEHAAPGVQGQALPRPSTSRSTSSSSRTSSAPSARCCASSPARPKCRACWWTSRRPAWPRACRRSCSSPRPRSARTSTPRTPIKIRLTRQLPPVRRVRERDRGAAAHRHAHDIDIKPDGKDAYDELSLELTAKTYRYLDEDEIAAAAADADKGKKTVHRPAPRPTG